MEGVEKFHTQALVPQDPSDRIVNHPTSCPGQHDEERIRAEVRNLLPQQRDTGSELDLVVDDGTQILNTLHELLGLERCNPDSSDGCDRIQQQAVKLDEVRNSLPVELRAKAKSTHERRDPGMADTWAATRTWLESDFPLKFEVPQPFSQRPATYALLINPVCFVRGGSSQASCRWRNVIDDSTRHDQGGLLRARNAPHRSRSHG